MNGSSNEPLILCSECRKERYKEEFQMGRMGETGPGILHELREEVVSLREFVDDKVFELQKAIEDLKEELLEITKNQKNPTIYGGNQ